MGKKFLSVLLKSNVGIGIKLFQRVLPNIYRITVPFHSSKILIDSFIDVSCGLKCSLYVFNPSVTCTK